MRPTPSPWWCAICNGPPVWGKPVRYVKGRWVHTDPKDCDPRRRR